LTSLLLLPGRLGSREEEFDPHDVRLDFDTVIVPEFSQAELEDIALQLRCLAPRAASASPPIIRWPKALDIISLHWNENAASPTWTTESDFARWFWQSAIACEKPISIRDRVARKLATALADRLAGSMHWTNLG